MLSHTSLDNYSIPRWAGVCVILPTIRSVSLVNDDRLLLVRLNLSSERSTTSRLYSLSSPSTWSLAARGIVPWNPGTNIDVHTCSITTPSCCIYLDFEGSSLVVFWFSEIAHKQWQHWYHDRYLEWLCLSEKDSSLLGQGREEEGNWVSHGWQQLWGGHGDWPLIDHYIPETPPGYVNKQSYWKILKLDHKIGNIALTSRTIAISQTTVTPAEAMRTAKAHTGIALVSSRGTGNASLATLPEEMSLILSLNPDQDYH